MKILNFGSLNIDHVYKVPHLVRPGETLSSLSCNRFPGGKGLNQSVAIARAGGRVSHAGKIGAEGEFLRNLLDREGVDISLLRTSDTPTGHAIIQVSPEGENSIVLFGGANRDISAKETREMLSVDSPGVFVLLQNEISSISEIINSAAKKGLFIVFNPAPMSKEVSSYALKNIHCFIFNEVEGEELTGEKEPKAIIDNMLKNYPDSRICLTLGAQGVLYRDKEIFLEVPAFSVDAVDTTAAGDTFVGYFTAGLAKGLEIHQNLRQASAAAAICVTREGAAPSIPALREIEEFLNGRVC